MARSLAFVLFLLAFSPFLAGQRENCELSVRVVASDERSIEGQIKVEVLSPQEVIATAFIVRNEPAVFRVANGRTYRLSVSGKGIESVNTSFFEINPLEQYHTEIVHVQPEKKNPAESTTGSPIISVSEMNIPKKANAEMKKGLEAYSKGDMGNAEAHFEKAVAEYPSYAHAYDMLGLVAIKNSNRSKARDFFSKAIDVDGTFLPAYVNLARLDLGDENYAESESLLAKAIAVNPSMPDALALLATTEFANKEYDKALADVQRTHALQNHEQFAEVHLMAGKVLRMQSRPEAAIEQFQLFLKEKPDSPQGESARQALAALMASQRP